MAHAYTPGLTVSGSQRIAKRRILPLRGEVLVKLTDRVTPDTVVARTELPGNVTSRNIAGELSIDPADVPTAMLKQEGTRVEKGEIVAQSASFFGLFKSQSRSPVTGTIENVSSVTGQVLFRELPIPVEVKAYVDGTIREIIPQEGVVVATRGAFIQGIFGIGGETSGFIKVAVDSPASVLRCEHLNDDVEGKIVVGGAITDLETIRMAQRKGARGIVIGGFNNNDLRELLGFDLGVAITGSEQIGITVVVTEGFGSIAMAEKTFALLSALAGRRGSINGATQIRAGVIRPEVIVPLADTADTEEIDPEMKGLMNVGSQVRVIRNPYFGRIGKVTALPNDLLELPTEARVRVVTVSFQDGGEAIIPRANVELMIE